MSTKRFLVALPLFFLYSGVSVGSVGSVGSLAPASPQLIRVRLSEAQSQVKVRGYDLEFYEMNDGVSKFMKAADQVSEWLVTCSSQGIRAVRMDQSVLTEKKRVLELGSSLRVHASTGFFQFEGRPYRDELRIYSREGRCQVVNHVSLEKYLDGLVNAEFSSKWNPEAIAAQVVAARTYAYYQILDARKNQNSKYDVDSTVKDQVYDGPVHEDSQASRIVEKTKGVVLTAMSGLLAVPIKAFYHSTCGGETELPQNVWGDSYLGIKRTVKCPYCVSSPRFKWSLSLRATAITEVLRRQLLPQSSQQGAALIDLKINHHRGGNGVGGRVSTVDVLWSTKGGPLHASVPAAKFREWMGYARFRSTSFQIEPHIQGSQRYFTFRGVGNGHGVGMCQWGAKVMGEKGFKMAAILKYYYPDAKLKKLW